VQRKPKITPSDYPDLLAAVDEGVTQRALARRYGCAPSLIARHVAKAKRLRDSSDLAQSLAADQSFVPIEGSTREILEAHIRDPRTPPRDLANLVNALARLTKDETATPPDSPALSEGASYPCRAAPADRNPGADHRRPLGLGGGHRATTGTSTSGCPRASWT
jgi:transposase-like protein